MDDFFSFFCGKWKKQTFLAVSGFFLGRCVQCRSSSSSCIFFLHVFGDAFFPDPDWISFFFLSQVKVIAGNLGDVFFTQNVGNSGKCPLIYDRGSLFLPPQPSYVFVPLPNPVWCFFGKGDCWYPKLEKGLRHRLRRSRQKGGFFPKKFRAHMISRKMSSSFFFCCFPKHADRGANFKKEKNWPVFLRRRRRKSTSSSSFYRVMGYWMFLFLVLALTTTYFSCRKKHH